MAYPSKPTLDYSYTGFATALGDGSFPGTQVDNDLANLKAATDSAVDFLTAAFNSEGRLNTSALPTAADITAYTAQSAASATAANGSASAAASSAAAAAASAVDAAASAALVTTTNFLAKANNLSDIPVAATARTNLGLGALAVKAAVDTADITDLNVTTAKIADSNVTTAKVADGAVTLVKNAAGGMRQLGYAVTGAVATGTTLIPFDDTVPQNTEGDQYMTLTVTPSNASNLLMIDIVFNGSHSAVGDFLSVALFQGATANALSAVGERSDTAGGKVISFRHIMVAGTTSATTFNVRAGGNSAGTTTFNGTGGARRFGGVAASSITITEIKV